MNRIVSATLFATAISAFAQADCQPGKDHRNATRKSAGLGVEVVNVNLSGTTTVDSVMLAKITDDMIGSCFDDNKKTRDELYSLFRAAGYVSVYIESVQIESISPAVTPEPVQVRGNVIEGQRCPTEIEGLHQFLLDHRSNSLEADPTCVDGAFSAMSSRARFQHSRFYTKALIQLLDFERNIDQDFKMGSIMSQYPATEYLDRPAYLPDLVDAIKQSDSELVRTNAAYTIQQIYRTCVQAAVARLKKDAEKPGTTLEEKERVQAAETYINELYGGPSPCRSIYGPPATERQAQRELDSQPE